MKQNKFSFIVDDGWQVKYKTKYVSTSAVRSDHCIERPELVTQHLDNLKAFSVPYPQARKCCYSSQCSCEFEKWESLPRHLY